jgi:16S rRNA (uracil1498-N3)-methyltransferase
VEVALPDAVAHHATRVLRLPEGAALTLFTGDGGEFSATLARIDKRGATARIDAFDPVEREAALAPTLVIAVIAADPMDFAVRKAVELGAAAIVPVVAARSQGAGAEKADKRLAHWRQIAVAACEQCGRNRVPPVRAVLPLREWIATRDRNAAMAAMLVPSAAQALATLARDTALREVVVGPEGGFTADEIEHAMAAGLLSAHLGPRVLRAETAALAALSTLNAVRTP